jgi:hypothetical protein
VPQVVPPLSEVEPTSSDHGRGRSISGRGGTGGGDGRGGVDRGAGSSRSGWAGRLGCRRISSRLCVLVVVLLVVLPVLAVVLPVLAVLPVFAVVLNIYLLESIVM